MTATPCPNCGHVSGPVQRFSITVPADLAKWVREKAEREGRTISSVVAEALRLHRDAAAIGRVR